MAKDSTNRKEALEALKADGLILEYAPKDLKKDLMAVGVAIQSKAKALSFASPSLLKSKANAYWFLAKNYHSFQYFPAKWRDDEELALTAFSLCRYICDLNDQIFAHLSDRLKHSKKFLLKALKTKYQLYQYLPEYLKEDKELVLALLIAGNLRIDSVPLKLLTDYDFVLSMIAHNPSISHDISIEWRKIKQDQKLLDEFDELAKISKSSAVFKTLSPAKVADLSFVKKAVKVNSLIFNYLPPKIKGEIDIALVTEEEMALNVIKEDYQSFIKIDSKLQKNPTFILRALAISDKIVTLIDDKLWDDKNFALDVLGLHHWLMYSFPTRLKENKDFVKKALKENPNIYGSLPQNIREMPDIAFCYIQKAPQLFNSLSQDLKTNKRFVRAAKRKRQALKPIVDQFLDEQIKPKAVPEGDVAQLQYAVARAQQLYAAWYHPSTRHLEEAFAKSETYERAKHVYRFRFFKDLTWFRHGQHGQDRARALKNKIYSLTEEFEIWEELGSFLTACGARYHEHSFASFLIDELITLKIGPLVNILPAAKDHRYHKDIVTKAFSDYLDMKQNLIKTP